MAVFFGVLKSRELQLSVHGALKKAAVSIARKLLDEDFMAQPQNHCKLEEEIWAAHNLIENRKDLGAGIELGRSHLEGLICLAAELKTLIYAKAAHIKAHKVSAGDWPPTGTIDSLLEGLANFNDWILRAREAMVCACFHFEFHVDRPFSRAVPDSEAKLVLTKRTEKLWRQQEILKELPEYKLPRSADGLGIILSGDLVGLDFKSPVTGNDNSNTQKFN
ncbi:MAG TPA: hypothetical protein VMT55_05590 [Candidatus Sulfotelmatobacter sp.]|nr:hypothetical protein [Candidatus Sulfotelmatobacter sp.]